MDIDGFCIVDQIIGFTRISIREYSLEIKE